MKLQYVHSSSNAKAWGDCDPNHTIQALSCQVDLTDFTATKYLDHLLLQAALSGDSAAMSEAISAGANALLRGAHGKQLSHWAASHGDRDALALLLASRVSAISQDKNNLRPLHLAAANGHGDIVHMLLQCAAHANVQYRNGIQPLHLGAKSGDMRAVGSLLQARAYVDSLTTFGWQPIHAAVAAGSREVIHILAESRAHLDSLARQSQNWQPIHIAAASGHSDVLHMLLERRILVNARDRAGRRPLDYAQYFGHENCMALLANMEADLVADDKRMLDDEEERNPIFKVDRIREENWRESQDKSDQDWSRQMHAVRKQQSLQLQRMALLQKTGKLSS